MLLVRQHARLISICTLAWHVVAVLMLSTVLTCTDGSGDHAALAACPMHKTEPQCELHSDPGTEDSHRCDCPKMGCSKSDLGFLAMFSAVGVLPSAARIPSLFDAGRASSAEIALGLSMPFLPAAPPPRS